MEDSKIIELFFARSEQAISELASKYGKLCLKIAKNILSNTSDAEECVNDTYLGAWNSIPPAKPDPLQAYICRIVRNISIMKYHSNTAAKRNSFYSSALDELELCLTSPVSVEDSVSANELAGLLDSFLDTLTGTERIMFVWRYWYADSISDIAENFNIRAGTAAVRLSRIRKKLRKYLEKEGYVI